MTTEHTPQDTTFADLAHMHSLLCDAHHNLHLAWMSRTNTTDDLDPNLSAAIDMVYAMQDRIYSALRRHPQHPLNAELDVPLAEDTAPTFTDRLIKAATEYRAYTKAGDLVSKGELIADFRGDMWVFDSITRGPVAGKQAKVRVTQDGRAMEFYASVFNLTVS